MTHACARCTFPLRFSTAENGDRHSACCGLAYQVDPMASNVVFVTLYPEQLEEPVYLGSMDLHRDTYRGARDKIRKEVEKYRGLLRDLI